MAMVVLSSCRSSAPTSTPSEPEPSASPVVVEASAAAAVPPAASEPAASAVDETEAAWAEYEQAVERAFAVSKRCRTDPARIKLNELVDTYEILAPYERSTARDQAIAALERCRRLASTYIAQNLTDPEAEPALDYTAELQQAVSEANARTTKRLHITVKGSKVTIDEKTGRKPQKRALEGYCAKVGANDADRVDRITDERGEMHCSSKFEFSKQSGYVDRRMGIAAPFELESTEGRAAPPPKE